MKISAVTCFCGVVLLAVAGCDRSVGPVPAAAQGETAAVAGAAAEAAAAQITAEQLRAQIAKLSDDEFQGRGTSTPGDDKARKYLAQQLQSMGYEPGGPDASWEQPMDLIGVTAAMPSRWEFRRGSKQLSLKAKDQFIAASGVQNEHAALDHAEVVFVGYGIQAPEYQWDDFKQQNLRGKVLLMLNNDPDWDPALFAGTTRLYYGRWTYKYESAARQGAAGAIIIHTTPSAGYPFQVVQTSWSGEQFELPATAGEQRIQVRSWVTESAARDLVALAGKNLDQLIEAAKQRDFHPVPLGVTTSLQLTNRVNRTRSANVLGLLRGADPMLRNEVVIYSAHHDHLGIGEPDAKGDRIYNGALDNGAGMAQVLAIAKAFKALPEPPKRSVLMLFVTAEEQGLLGSAYYAAHPTFPAGKIAADINYDGGNIWGRTRDVTFIGKGKSTIDNVVDAVAKQQGRVVKPDQMPDRGHYYRSDQFSFAEIGVPALYLDTGTDFIGRPPGWGKEQIEDYEAHRYHQPSDQIDDSWNYDGMIEDAQLGFWTGLLLANAAQMPSWKPGDEFEAARKKAITDSQEVGSR